MEGKIESYAAFLYARSLGVGRKRYLDRPVLLPHPRATLYTPSNHVGESWEAYTLIQASHLYDILKLVDRKKNPPTTFIIYTTRIPMCQIPTP